MATLTIASKNYGSWSLRGWLLCKMAGLEFEEQQAKSDDPSTRAELLLLSPSFLVPCLTHDGVKVWDTLAIAEYLHELKPDAKLMPADRAARAHCPTRCSWPPPAPSRIWCDRATSIRGRSIRRYETSGRSRWPSR